MGLLTKISLLLVISERLSYLEPSGTVLDSESVFWNNRLLTFSLESKTLDDKQSSASVSCEDFSETLTSFFFYEIFKFFYGLLVF